MFKGNTWYFFLYKGKESATLWRSICCIRTCLWNTCRSYVTYQQGDLGHDSTSFCTDQNSSAIFSVSSKKVCTDVSDNGLNWPCKIMMSCMMTGRLFFQRHFPTFHDVLRFDSNHFSSKTDLISTRCSSLTLLEATCYLKGAYSNQMFFLRFPASCFSDCIVSVQDIWCYRSNFPQLPRITMHCTVDTAWINVLNSKSMSFSYSGSHPPDWGLDQ